MIFGLTPTCFGVANPFDVLNFMALGNVTAGGLKRIKCQDGKHKYLKTIPHVGLHPGNLT